MAETENKENGTRLGMEKVYHKSTDRGAFMVFSPSKGPTKQEPLKYYLEQPKAKDNILICAKFQNSLYLEFGNVPVRSTNFLSFKLQNPNPAKGVHIEIDKFQESKGLSIVFGAMGTKEIDIGPSESAIGTVYWTPTSDMSIREIVKLKMDHKAPLQLTIHGIAGSGKVNQLLGICFISIAILHYIFPNCFFPLPVSVCLHPYLLITVHLC